MMMNLFSIFDPTSFLNLKFNWISLSMMIIILPIPFWIFPSRVTSMFFYFTKIMKSQMESITPHKYMMIAPMSTFIFIIGSNMMGLLPHVFTNTGHMMINLSVSLIIWTAMMQHALMSNTMKTLAHLVPLGTPIILTTFMVIVEMISLLIRPITLAVRLTANMIAGHLLLSLLGNTIMMAPLTFTPTMMLVSTSLFILELAVAMIQAYVFTVLIILYINEATHWAHN